MLSRVAAGGVVSIYVAKTQHLFNLLKNELRKGELLLPFLNNLRKSGDKATAQWLERPLLLELTLQKDTDSSVAISFSTRRTRSLRVLIESAHSTPEINKLINQSFDFIFSSSNITQRYTRSQLHLIMEYCAKDRRDECNLFVLNLHTSGRLNSVINSMKPDALLTVWKATKHFRSNSKARTAIKKSLEELLEKRLKSAHPLKKEMLAQLSELSTSIGPNKN